LIGDVAVAVAFLTRLPVRQRAALTATDLSRAALWFPLVGALVGAVMGGTRAAANLALGNAAAGVLAVLAAILVTGGLHEDGLADSADALGAHAGRARRLEILRDPRVGTYGALAIAFAVVLPVAVLSPLDDGHFLRAAVVAHVLARWSALPQSTLVPPARPDGSGRLVRTTWPVTLFGTLTAVAATLAVAGPTPGGVALALAAATTASGGWIALRALGGVCGDTYGAVNKLVELAVYAGLAAVWASQ
jgi:adenosylcobinamide-GDP ribazoletransferase